MKYSIKFSNFLEKEIRIPSSGKNSELLIMEKLKLSLGLSTAILCQNKRITKLKYSKKYEPMILHPAKLTFNIMDPNLD